MADKQEQSPTPMLRPQVNGHGYGDTEARAAHDTRELKKKKRIKCAIYIVLFAIFQSIVIAVFAVVIAKVRTPRFRVHSGTLENFNGSAQANILNAHFTVKNANFGRYTYRNTTVQFFYQDTPIGEMFVPNSHVGWRTTRRVNGIVNLNLDNNAQLATDLSNGIVPITSRARMTGRVAVIFFMKKNRATNMNCSMEIATATQQLQNIVCN